MSISNINGYISEFSDFNDKDIRTEISVTRLLCQRDINDDDDYSKISFSANFCAFAILNYLLFNTCKSSNIYVCDSTLFNVFKFPNKNSDEYILIWNKIKPNANLCFKSFQKTYKHCGDHWEQRASRKWYHFWK